MRDYGQLDSAILEYINLHYGKTPANSLMLEQIAMDCNPYLITPWRAVDRRTQALRRAGKIKLDEKRNWVKQ